MPSSLAMLPVLQWAGIMREEVARKIHNGRKTGSNLASTSMFTKPSSFMHSFLWKDLGKKGETSGEMEWVQAVGMDKREERMRDEPTVFSARGRGTSEGRSTDKGSEREDPKG